MRKMMTFSQTMMMMMLFGMIDFIGIKYFLSTNNHNAKIKRLLPYPRPSLLPFHSQGFRLQFVFPQLGFAQGVFPL